jgi:hypothetical protein
MPLSTDTTLVGFIAPTVDPANPSYPGTVLELHLDDLDLTERRDTLILIWGALFGTGTALLADAMSKMGARLLGNT